MRYNSLQEWAAQLKAGVGVYFDEPGPKVDVEHEIQPKYLEIVLLFVLVQEEERAHQRLGGDLFHFGQSVREKIQIPAIRIE